MRSISRPSTFDAPSLADYDRAINTMLLAAETPATALQLWRRKITLKRVLERAPLEEVDRIACAELVALRALYPTAVEVPA